MDGVFTQARRAFFGTRARYAMDRLPPDIADGSADVTGSQAGTPSLFPGKRHKTGRHIRISPIAMEKHTKSDAPTSLSVVLIGTPLVIVLVGIATDSQTAQDWGQMSMWILYPIAAWLMTRSSKLKALSVDELLAQDKRPPVLYLRSFSEDMRNPRGRILKAIFDPTDGYQSREEEMVEWAEAIGPVVAVGHPGERLPELGAARSTSRMTTSVIPFSGEKPKHKHFLETESRDIPFRR